mgnify:CR=1 FL=1
MTMTTSNPHVWDGSGDELEAAEVALAELEAKRAHLVGTYGDAADTVAANLGGDSRFLSSNGGAAATPAAGSTFDGQINDHYNGQDRLRNEQARGLDPAFQPDRARAAEVRSSDPQAA